MKKIFSLIILITASAGINKGQVFTPTTVTCGAGCSDSIMIDGEKVLVYPNPGNGKFTITVENAENQLTVQVYNLLGDLVFKTSIYSTKTEMDLGKQVPGLYFYRVVTEDGTAIATGKLLIE